MSAAFLDRTPFAIDVGDNEDDNGDLNLVHSEDRGHTFYSVYCKHARRGGAYPNTYEEGSRSAHIRIAMSGSIEPDVIIFWLGCVYQHKVNFGKVK